MAELKPPGGLRLSEDTAENWKRFKQRMELYFIATATKEPRTKQQKAAIFLHVAGQEAIDVFNTFQLTADEKEDYDVLVQQFEDYCLPRVNETYERYVFRTRVQEPGEAFELFFRDLQLKARTCNFGDLSESMLRDQIVYGTASKKLRERLLREKDLTLSKAVDFSKSAEISERQNKTFEHVEETVDPVASRMKCKYCSYVHEPRLCPAFGKACKKCGKKNHFAKVCNSAKKSVDNVINQTTGSRTDTDDFDILSVNGERGKEKRDWMVTAKIGSHEARLKVDTGAQANLLPLSMYKRLRLSTPLEPSSTTLRSYGGATLEHMGKVCLDVQIHGQRGRLNFFIMKKGRQALLGLEACEKFGLVNRVDSIENKSDLVQQLTSEFPGLFKGLGKTKTEYRMVLKDDAQPVVIPARRVPHALRGPLKAELDRMVAGGIIAKVQEPTDWVSPLVVVRKKTGKIRVCMDPKHVNAALKREHFQLPRREDIEAELADAKYFSKLDANNGFHQIPLDNYTSKICTFATPFGRYRYLRLPFGIASAPEVFQKTMSQIFDDLPGVRVYIDDVLVWGTSREEHDLRLRAALRAAQLSGITLNAEKCTFGVDEIRYLGDKISRSGIKPDPELVQCLREMPLPTSKKEVQRLLGAVNYFGKFLPNLSSKTAMLRDLIKEDSLFEWSDVHTREWCSLQQMLTEGPVLAIFDPSKPIKLSTDASKGALGAALFQQHGKEWRPVGYASRVLTDSEGRYSQIEKENLGIVFGCEKFHDFVYGQSIMIETDHRPLLAIAQKAIGDMPPRLQRLFLRLMRYEFTLQFVPGKQLILADALSRIRTGSSASTTDDVDVHATGVLSTLVSDKTKARLVKETAQDSELQDVIHGLMRKAPLQGKFKPFRSELSFIDGVLLKGSKVVIPRSLRLEMLQRVHCGHLGLGKCQSRARQLMFWPGMTADITAWISKCSTCKHFTYRHPDEPLLLRETPRQPWARVGADLCHFAGKNYLVIYDSYSNFPEVAELQDTTSRTVISTMESIFSRHGIPIEVCTDGGPQFAARDFSDFAARFDFVHVTSSPYFPRSNGLAEKGVQVVKRLLKKCEHSGDDFWLGLLNYRATPLECGTAPAELLMGRRPRTLLPDFATPPARSVRKHTQNLNRGHQLAPLKEGDSVRVRGDKAWDRKAQVVGGEGPRSYRILTDQGREMRRNRQHLLKTEEAPSFLDEFDSDGYDTADEGVPPSTPSLPGHRGTDSLSTPAEQAAQGNSTSSTTSQNSPPSSPSLRRSSRQVFPPQRLTYDENFQQVV